MATETTGAVVEADAVERTGPGRPAKVLEMVPDRTLPERAQVIGEYHESARAAGAQAVLYAIMAGFELMAARAQLRHGQWEAWLKAHCPVHPATAWRYMELAERRTKQLPNLARVQDLTRQLAPHEWTPAQREQVMAAVRDATVGESVKQLYLDLGIVKGDPYQAGGFAPLISWLRKEFPDCKARRVEDLPPEIRAEWEEHLKRLRAEIGMEEQAKVRKTWGRALDKLFRLVEKRSFACLTPEEIQHAAGLCRDMHRALCDHMKG